MTRVKGRGKDLHGQKKVVYGLAGLVSLITFVVYLPALRNHFLLWDDDLYIVNNPFIKSFNVGLLRSAFFDFYAGNWHPLTWISHALDYAIWGLNPLGHHLTNNVLHSINTFLVVVLVVRLLASRHVYPPLAPPRATRAEKPASSHDSRLTSHASQFTLVAAGVTGVLFGIHPVHVESVAWVAERKDLLCAFFYLLSVMSYVKYAANIPQSAERIEHRANNIYFAFTQRALLFALCFFILALMSKPMAVSLPLVLLLLDWYPFGRITSMKTFRGALVEKVPFIALSIISSILTFLAQKSNLIPIESVPLPTRLLISAKACIVYLWKMMLPLELVPIYPYPLEVSPLSLKYLFPLVLVAVITLICLFLLKRRPLWFSLWAYYIVTLIPVLGVVQVGRQWMADRYAYLPSIGLFLMAGLAVALFTEKVGIFRTWKRAAVTASVVLVASVFTAAGYFTVRQTGIWRDSITLWSYVIEKEPEKFPLAYNNRGVAYQNIGETNRALEDYNKAISLAPSYDAYFNRGNAFDGLGRPDKAIEDYSRAIALEPSKSGAYNNRGITYQNIGETDRALEDYNKAISLTPSYDAYFNRGSAFEELGWPDKAIEDYSRAIALEPSKSEAYNNRGIAYQNIGETGKALEDYNKAITLDPANAEAFLNRGNFYLRAGDRERAVSDFREACTLGNTEGCNLMRTFER